MFLNALQICLTLLINEIVVFAWVTNLKKLFEMYSPVNVFDLKRSQTKPENRFINWLRYLLQDFNLTYFPTENAAVWQCTRWFKYDRDWLCVNKSQFVPVIFKPPCTSDSRATIYLLHAHYDTAVCALLYPKQFYTIRDLSVYFFLWSNLILNSHLLLCIWPFPFISQSKML